MAHQTSLVQDMERKKVIRLQEKHLKNAQLVSDRFHILNKLPKNGVVLEVGVLAGDWSMQIIKQNAPKRLALVDTFYSEDYNTPKRFKKKTHLDFITNKFTDIDINIDIRKGLSWDMMKTFDKDEFDWIYIDAGHDYDSVKRDLEEAFRILKPNGYLVMNDYIMYDHYTKEQYGVVKATNEFMIDNDFEMLYFAFHPEMFCDVVIRKIQ